MSAIGRFLQDIDRAWQRIGALMPTREDHWWEVGTDADAEAVGLDVEHRYRELGGPWLASISAYRGLMASKSLLRGDLARAGLAILEGDREEARRIVRDVEARSSTLPPGYVGLVRALAGRHSLDD